MSHKLLFSTNELLDSGLHGISQTSPLTRFPLGGAQASAQSSAPISGTTSRRWLGLSVSALPLVAALTMLATTDAARAADAVCVDPNNPSATVGTPAGTGDSVACGEGAVTGSAASVVVGANATIDTHSSGSLAFGSGAHITYSQGALAFGQNAGVNGGDSRAGYNSNGAVALGNGATIGASSGGAAAIGNGATIGSFSFNSMAIGNGASVSNQSESSVALGNGATISGANSNFSVALGYRATASAPWATAIGQNALAGDQSTTAIGSGAAAVYSNSIAIGSGAVTTYYNTIALGNNASAGGRFGIALGNGAVSQNDNSVSIGSAAQAVWSNSIAIGSNARITYNNSVTIGSDSSAEGNAVAVGQSATAAGTFGVAVGNGAVVGQRGYYGVAIGNGASVSTSYGVAIGNGAISGEANALAAGNGATASGLSSLAFGQSAVATAQNAMAFGTSSAARGANSLAFGANSTASADNSFAFGANAQAGTANSVALGASSQTAAAVGTASATIAGTSYTFAGGTPGGTISVGSDTLQRTVTNVAAGRLSGTSTDAVNGSQLFATNQAVNGLNTSVTNLNTNALQWSTALGAYDASHGSGAPQQITNVADAALTGSSTDAVNGRQLFATNQTVAGLNTNVTNLNTNALQWSTALGAYDASHGSGAPQRITNVADAALSATSSDAVNGRQLFATNELVSGLSNDLGNLNANALLWNASISAFDAGRGLGTAHRITYVAAGDLSAASTDAVNGSQLYATNQTVAGLSTNALQWDATLGAYDASHGTGSAQNITNVADGALTGTSTDAVNGSQLYATNQTVAGLSTDLGNLNANALLWSSALGAFDASRGGVAQRITYVAAGDLSATSTDAVNGSQLYETNQTVASNAATVSSYLGGGADVTNGVAPSYSVQGGTHHDVGSALNAVDNNLTTLNNQITNVAQGGTRYFQSNSTGTGAAASGTDSTAIGASSVASGTNSIAAGTNAQAEGSNAVALGANAVASNTGDVALGSGSVTQTAVQTSTMEVNGTTYQVAGNATSTVSVGAEGAERTITNVAAGRVNATSTDAVNGSQLNATNEAISRLDSSIGTLNRNAVQYDSTAAGGRGNSITLQGGDPSAPVLISNVAAGVANTDAVNVAQLHESAATTLSTARSYTDTRFEAAVRRSREYTDTRAAETLRSANAYTDEKFASLTRDIGDVRRQAGQAAAIGLAASSLRYDDRPGKLSVAMGGGNWKGENAMAMGLGYTSLDQSVRANLSAANAGGDWGVGLGVSFTLN
ncbi:outer membrane protein [Paracoccus aminophilus JCM 7686]|uniref:Outer membrane protein n=2 Tax=Paracoccus aminophilus TaxID=34003 RepID=S5YYM9_PARAH|nr:outer membrane protein [Paracoccus aminophilus JCM 7686]